MLIMDGILFTLFCYKWYKIISKLKSKHKYNALVMFKIQFVITIFAILSCAVMVTVNFVWMEYETLMSLSINCAVTSTCNALMLKESREKLLCGICGNNENKKRKQLRSSSNVIAELESMGDGENEKDYTPETPISNEPLKSDSEI